MTSSPPTFAAPPDHRGVRRVEFRALGTHCSIQFRHPDEKTSLLFLAKAIDWLSRFEAKFSRFQPDSIVSKINAAAGETWVEIDHETEQLLDLATDLFQRTDGILDPTLLPLLKVWDWKTVHTALPSEAKIKSALELTGLPKIERKSGHIRLPKAGMGLDFGGFGKEFAVDQLAKIAHHHGVNNFLIDLGRDIFAKGSNGQHPFWHVGLENAQAPDQCWGGLAVSDYAVATSGDYARRFEHNGIRYGHIIDPRSGWPVSNGMRGVTITAPTCLQAGVYSTAVFVLGAEEGLKFASRAKKLDACIQNDTGTNATPGFINRLVQG